jgi:bacteriorhodopsin
MKECPYCSRPLADAAITCKRCGSDWTNGADVSQRAPTSEWFWGVLAVVLAAALLVGYCRVLESVMH